MWPNIWKRKSILRTHPDMVSYDEQTSERKISLFTFKKVAINRDSLINSAINIEVKDGTKSTPYTNRVLVSLEVSLSNNNNTVLPEPTSKGNILEKHSEKMNPSAMNALSSLNGITREPASKLSSNNDEKMVSSPQSDLIPHESQSELAQSRAAPLSRPGKLASATTLDMLIETLVNGGDFRFISDFFITYRLFVSPVQLCKLLISRFADSLETDTVAPYNIRNQIQAILVYWLERYFDFDFVPCAALRFTLGNFLKSTRAHPKVTSSPVDSEIFTHICKVYQHLRRAHRKPSQSISASTTRAKRHHKELLHKGSIDSMISSRSESLMERNFCQSDLTTSNSSVKLPDEKSLNQWTMKMMCGLASLKSQLPEVCHSLVSGAPNPLEESHLNNRGTSRPITMHVVNTEPFDHSHGDIPRSVGIIQQEQSFLFFYTTEMIAQQLCIIEQQYLCAVEWHELVEVLWKNRSDKASSEKCSGVLDQIDRFNIMCQWVATEIVICENIEARVRTIEKLIRVAMRCYQHRNYNTLFQILLGLQSSNVSRLIQTWKRVGLREKRTFEELKRFTSPCKNWLNIRSAMHKSSDDYRNMMWCNSKQPDCKIIGEACIPFFGLFLSDLTYNSELPSYVPVVASVSAVADEPLKLINFHKHRITASVIKWLLTFQDLAKRYPFLPDVSVFPKSLFLKHLNDTEIRQLSLRCE